MENENSTTDTGEMERSQVILKINYVSSQNSILYHIGNTTLLIIEIVCYLMLIASIGCAFIFPTKDMIIGTSEEDSMSTHDIIVLKIVILIFGIFMLLPAYICQTLRRKNHKLKEVNRISAEYIKAHNVT